MKSEIILCILFITFGSYAIINPKSISLSETEKSYDVKDLIRGWGIYSSTIGGILAFPEQKKNILLICFIYSIIWHIDISNKKSWTLHHKHSIIANSVAILLTIKSKFKKKKK